MLVSPPEALVLDPFAGSGTAGLAALSTGRSYVGMEITTHYATVAAQQLHEATQ
jgi:site-specific DNA-methyltransferase (adenine-specific)